MTTTATTLFEARKNLKKITDDVADFDDHVIITKPKNRNVVIISEKEFQSWKETLYLFGTETNRKNLDESLNQLNKSQSAHNKK
jgi:antitoxin YefM